MQHACCTPTTTNNANSNTSGTAALQVPELQAISQCLQGALSKNFQRSSCRVVKCPNLTEKPWCLAARGFGGRTKIADCGGPDNLNYIENNRSEFHFDEVAKDCGISNAFLMGPAAGHYSITSGVNSELIANCNLAEKKNLSKSVIVTQDGGYKQSDYDANRIGPLANLLVTDGQEGQEVIEVRASVRTGKQNFVSCMKQALHDQFGGTGKLAVGMAGVFQIVTGKIKAHVMPDFLGKDMLNQKVVDDWLCFYEMRSPVTCLSVFVSSDTNNLGLRLEHTHFYSEHGDGGHYHYDTTPDDVEYFGFFTPCDTVFRLGAPKISQERANNLFQK